MEVPDRPRNLRDPQARVRRRELLDLPHIAPLSRYAAALRSKGDGAVPEFDPLDGGVAAKVLFLFEKPGPMTDSTRSETRAGSGFISRDNDDPTAEATFLFMSEAGLPRRQTVIWNVVPWWNGTRKISRAELRDGFSALSGLISLLPDLRAIVLVGRKAARAKSLLANRGFKIIESSHPSPIVRASRPHLWRSISREWAEVKPLLDSDR